MRLDLVSGLGGVLCGGGCTGAAADVTTGLVLEGGGATGLCASVGGATDCAPETGGAFVTGVATADGIDAGVVEGVASEVTGGVGVGIRAGAPTTAARRANAGAPTTPGVRELLSYFSSRSHDSTSGGATCPVRRLRLLATKRKPNDAI